MSADMNLYCVVSASGNLVKPFLEVEEASCGSLTLALVHSKKFMARFFFFFLTGKWA